MHKSTCRILTGFRGLNINVASLIRTWEVGEGSKGYQLKLYEVKLQLTGLFLSF